MAVLVRAGWQGNSIVAKLDKKGIKYFNALFKETDPEYLKFYSIAIEEFHNTTSGKAVQRDLQKCLNAVKSREHEIYHQDDKKFIFEAMYKLLEVLFNHSRNWEGTSKDKYENIEFALANNGLKHMMEFIDESVVLTSIHSAKGLEWDYVIIPKLNSFSFPGSVVCKACQAVFSCKSEYNYCEFLFEETMEKTFKEEISVLYVAVTRAKKDVFITVNIGKNHWNYAKKTSCLLNLKGLSTEDYDWEEVNMSSTAY